MEYTTRPLKWIIAPEGEHIFCEHGTLVEIVDEACGEYVSVTQQADTEEIQKIFIDEDEWPLLKRAVNKAFSEIRKHKRHV